MKERTRLIWQYRLAWVLFGALLLVTIFGSWLMPHRVGEEYKITYVTQVVNGQEQQIVPPLAPDSTYWLGTDHRGYDVLSLLLNGAKVTLGFALLVTLLRFVVALPLGLLAGATGKGRGVLSLMQLVTTSVPTLLFVFPAMYGLNKVLPPEQSGMVLFVLLVVFGVFQVAHQFAERAAFYNGKLYVSAARTMGATHRQVVWKHLVPHLRPEILFALLTELVQVLFLIGQLAVVTIFLGGGEEYEIDSGAPPSSPKIAFELTTSGEWGGMVAYGIKMLRYYPWILLSAGAFLAMSILVLSFFSKQMQAKMDRPYLYGMPRPFWQNRTLRAGLAAVAAGCVLLVTLFPNKAPVEVRKWTEPDAPGGSQPASVQPVQKELNPKVKQAIEVNVQSFMKYLAEDKWKYAVVYMASKTNNVIYVDAVEPDPPFDRWIRALTTEGYQYTGIGKIEPIHGEPGRYHLELQVTASGQPVSWGLDVVTMESTSRIDVKVTGGTE